MSVEMWRFGFPSISTIVHLSVYKYMFLYLGTMCVSGIPTHCLPTLFPPEVLFVVDHALDDGAHGDTADQLVPQRR